MLRVIIMSIIMHKKLSRSLLPLKHNNYAPTILQKGAMVGLVFLVLLSFSMSSLYALLWQQSEWLLGAVLPATVLSLTNTERAEYEAKPLKRNQLLDEAARLKAEHMAAEGYFSHYSPGGISPWFWFEKVGYTYAHAGENLAVHFSDSGEVVKAWMDSPSHKANIISDQYTEIGIGTAKGRFEGFDTVFVVQMFGTPASLPAVTDRAGELDVIPERPLATIVLENEKVEVAVEDMTEADYQLAFDSTFAETRVLGEEEVVVIEDLRDALEGEYAVLAVEEISTTSDLVPITATTLENTDSVGSVAELATQPNKILRLVYALIGGLVIISLLASVALGVKRHRPMEISYGVLLLLLMVGLVYLHLQLTAGAVVI